MVGCEQSQCESKHSLYNAASSSSAGRSYYFSYRGRINVLILSSFITVYFLIFFFIVMPTTVSLAMDGLKAIYLSRATRVTSQRLKFSEFEFTLSSQQPTTACTSFSGTTVILFLRLFLFICFFLSSSLGFTPFHVNLDILNFSRLRHREKQGQFFLLYRVITVTVSELHNHVTLVIDGFHVWWFLEIIREAMSCKQAKQTNKQTNNQEHRQAKKEKPRNQSWNVRFSNKKSSRFNLHISLFT